jgi:hypothetical protein
MFNISNGFRVVNDEPFSLVVLTGSKTKLIAVKKKNN